MAEKIDNLENLGQHRLNHLRELEAEAIFVIRETAAQFDNPALLFSGGKDSIVLFHLARKAFYPGRVPFPLLHIDTGHNFQETLEFRDYLVDKYGVKLLVGYVEDTIKEGKAKEDTGYYGTRNAIQSITLLDMIEKYKIDAALGGARRDEEKARAKERFFSHRDIFGQWDPKNQRPELWNLFNGRKHLGEHFRVFPLSNWTELDVWLYIYLEQIELPSLYFTHRRKVFNRDGVWLAWAPFMRLKPDEKVEERDVRCRTIGDIPTTGLTLSMASTVEEIVYEVATTNTTERGMRFDDKVSETSMEDRKREGYF